MSSPLNDSGATSRRIRNQMPAAATGGAVIGLYLSSLATMFVVNVLRFAFSYPTRMYIVGFRFWGTLALVAFAQGAFLIGGPVLVHPALMFILLGLAFVMHSQKSILNNLHVIRHERSRQYLDIYLNGLTGKIAIMTLLLWICVALAIWWSPDTSVVLKWIGLGDWTRPVREFWFDWFVIAFLQIVVGNAALKFLIENRINQQIKMEYEGLAAAGRRYSDERKRSIEKTIIERNIEMKSDVRNAQSENATGIVITVAALFAGLYWLIIWHLHAYQIKWTFV